MRNLIITVFIVAASPATLAQSDTAGELAALRALIEEQNRLLVDQGAKLDALIERVAELEDGRTVSTPKTVAGLDDTDDAISSLPIETGERNVPSDVNELSLEHKDSLRTGRETVIVEDAIGLSEQVDIYGSFRVFAEAGDDDPSLSDGSSRLGFRLARDYRKASTMFGRAEWKVNLVDNDSEFVASDNPAGGGIIVETEDSGSVLSTRLGYLGVRWDGIGELTAGKQWSVYYDVAGWTDNFNIYGGAGLSVFPAGSDGGAVGSGRADNALVFRSARGPVSYGVQTQLRQEADGGDYLGLGGSLIFSPSEAWDIGIAFAAAKIEGNFETLTGDDESGTAVLGARYHAGKWNAALNVAAWKDHDAVFLDDETVIYDGTGAELFVSYDYTQRLQLYGGFNYTNPDVDDPRIDPDFGTEHLIFGASYYPTKESFAYAEALVSTGEDETGDEADSVLSVGYRFDF